MKVKLQPNCEFFFTDYCAPDSSSESALTPCQYLLVNKTSNIEDEVDFRISKASQSFGRLRALIWDRRGLKLSTKMQVYKAVILITLLYTCETWSIY